MNINYLDGSYSYTDFSAYEDLIDGKFQIPDWEGDIEFIDVIGIELDYRLDSKGYYQPVYLFNSIIDGEEYTIIIPALL